MNMEFFLIIIVGIIIFYFFFRKKSSTIDKDKELKAEAFDLTMKQEKVVAHSKLFDQTDMFLDIVHEGFSQKWTDSAYEEEKKAGQEIKELKIQFETVKKLKFVGKKPKIYCLLIQRLLKLSMTLIKSAVKFMMTT